MSRPTKRRLVPVLAAGLVIAACSGAGGDADDVPTDDAVAATTLGGSDEPVGGADTVTTDVADAGDEPTATTAPPPSASSTTTTTMPPPQYALGEHWQSVVAGAIVGTANARDGLHVIDDELWLVGSRANAPRLWRSTDTAAWGEIALAPPPSSGALSVVGLVRGDDRFLAWGSRLTDCLANEDLGDGFRETGPCRRYQPVVYLSDDGVEWRSLQLDLGGGGSIVIADVTAVDGGFVAVGTARSQDWHGRVWFSPDGETWELVTELRGADGPMSGYQVHWDGEQLVLMALEHPCSQDSINFNTPGWILGAQWAEHLRMWIGPDVSSLEPIAAADHPILEPPLEVDCAITSGFDLAAVPYPFATGEVIGGVITLQDQTPAPQPTDDESGDDSDEDEPEPNPYRLVSLVDGDWSVETTDGVDRAPGWMVDLGGTPAFVRARPDGRGRSFFDLASVGDDGRWSLTVPERSVVNERGADAVAFGDTLVVVGRLPVDPFETFRTTADPVELIVSTSRSQAQSEVSDCVPAAGSTCLGARFELVPSYPDLDGADFSGADLRYAELGVGDYTNASFAGSNLLGARSGGAGGTPSFRGVDFSGAVLRGSALGDVAGATFAGADLRDASAEFSDLIGSLEGALLEDASFRVTRRPDGTVPALEVSLAGLDLTDVSFDGPFNDEGISLTVTDLRGSVLDGTSFNRVDLTGVALDDGVELVDVDVWDSSLCPDGEPPTDGPIGTCVRSAAPEE